MVVEKYKNIRIDTREQKNTQGKIRHRHDAENDETQNNFFAFF